MRLAMSAVVNGSSCLRSALMSNSSALMVDSFDVAGFEQFIEERPVVDHGLAQVFRGGPALGVAHYDVVRRAIVLDDGGITHRDVRRSLLEVGHGIAAVNHDAADQPVCRADGGRRVIDEAALHGGPLHRVGFAIYCREGAERKRFHALFAIGQICFGAAGVAVLLKDGAVVLRPEAAFQLSSCSFLRRRMASAAATTTRMATMTTMGIKILVSIVVTLCKI